MTEKKDYRDEGQVGPRHNTKLDGVDKQTPWTPQLRSPLQLCLRLQCLFHCRRFLKRKTPSTYPTCLEGVLDFDGGLSRSHR